MKFSSLTAHQGEERRLSVHKSACDSQKARIREIIAQLRQVQLCYLPNSNNTIYIFFHPNNRIGLETAVEKSRCPDVLDYVCVYDSRIILWVFLSRTYYGRNFVEPARV